jgi:hypothetical protein
MRAKKKPAISRFRTKVQKQDKNNAEITNAVITFQLPERF